MHRYAQHGESDISDERWVHNIYRLIWMKNNQERCISWILDEFWKRGKVLTMGNISNQRVLAFDMWEMCCVVFHRVIEKQELVRVVS